jgi:4-carboxymuconolactone decarboxylase
VSDSARAPLDLRLEALVRLSARLACGNTGGWREAIDDALRAAPATEVEETILQAYLFVGFPTVLNAFTILRAAGVEPPPPRDDPSAGDRVRLGEALCRRVYGTTYERLRSRISELHPALDRWMVEEGYGKTLSRPGLAAADRELCAVGLLAAGGHVPQLRSHLRGALHMGAPPEAVSEALAIGIEAAAGEDRSGAPEAGTLLGVWDDVRGRAETSGCSSI